MLQSCISNHRQISHLQSVRISQMPLLCMFVLSNQIRICDVYLETDRIRDWIVGLSELMRIIIALDSTASLNSQVLVISTLFFFLSGSLNLFCLGGIHLVP